MEPRLPEASASSSAGPAALPTVSVRPLQTVSEPSDLWTLRVCPTTGGVFEFKVPDTETVDNFKRTVGRKLKLSKERINLLFKERLLKDGMLRDHGVGRDSRLTLLPNVESGLLSQKTDHSVAQALENLTDHQVNEFLTGKSPLTLAMRLGDHMMFVQLQLSTTGTHAKRGSVPPCTVTSPRPATRSMPSSPGSRSPLQPTPLYPHQHPHRLHSPRTQFPFHSPPSSPTSPPPSPTSPTSPSAGPFSRVLLPSAPSGDRSTHHVAARSTHHVAARAPTNTGRVAGKRKRSMSSSEDDLLDTDTLAQASRNLSEKLKELSSQSPPSPKRLATGSPSPSSTASQRTQVHPGPSGLGAARHPSGAIIESMHHHGQGVYSGTFSGTLNPTLQERDGRPKRSINTIVHILNDLLGASPQYRAHTVAARATEVTTRSKSHRASHRPLSPPHRLSKTFVDRQRLSLENRATRGKVEHLKQMLQERRHRRRARREARNNTAFRLFHRTSADSSSSCQQGQACDRDNLPEGSAYSQQLQETAVA